MPCCAHARELHGASLPSVALPSISAFLPNPSTVAVMPLNEFLARAGLPTWDELGLPPVSELLKPAGGPQGARLPSPAQIAARANEVLSDVSAQLLPPQARALLRLSRAAGGGLKTVNASALAAGLNVSVPPALARVRLPVNTTAAVLKALKVPGTQSSLFAAAVRATSSIQAAWNSPITLPPLGLPKGLHGPSLDQLVVAVSRAAQLAGALPKGSELPTLGQVLTVLGALNSALAKAQRAA